MAIGFLFGVLALALLNTYATALVRNEQSLVPSAAKRSYLIIWCVPVLGALFVVLSANLEFFHQRQAEKEKREHEVFLTEIARDKGVLIETDGNYAEGGCGDGE